MAMFHTQNGFLKAAMRGELETLREYLTHAKQDWLSVKTDEGLNALHLASERGRTEAMSLLIDAGADINAQTPSGRTALMMSIDSKQADAFQLLMNHQANITLLNREGQSALYLAAYHNKPAIAEALLDAGANINDGISFMRALRSNAAQTAKLFLARGVNHHVVDSGSQYHPVHCVASSGYTDLFKILLEKGDIDLNVRTKDGNTALHIAATNGHIAMVEALLQEGASPDIENADGMTPADAALKKDKTQAAKIIAAAARKLHQQAERQQTYAVPGSDISAADGRDVETWVPMGANKIAHVGVYPALERKLTTIFNFESRERLLISENLRSGVENTLPAESFDALSDEALESAARAFESSGNHLDRSRIFKNKLGKKPLGS